MYGKKSVKVYKLPRFWVYFLSVVILLGIYFRCTYLDEKVYWIDEVATSLRVAGYTPRELIAELSEKGSITPSELQKYQRIDSKKNFFAALKAFKGNPEHAPLYFIIARFWQEIFGGSVTTIRSLSVVFSLLALPCFYRLCVDLTGQPFAGWLGVSFFSVSPFFIAYGQEARPYSLWILTILLSNLTLLRSIRFNKSMYWLGYTSAQTISIYTSLLSFLVMLGQLVYVVGYSKFSIDDKVKKFFLACIIAFSLFIPWLIIIFQNLQVVDKNTIWMEEPMPVWAIALIWLYGISCIFINSPISHSLNIYIVTRILIDLNIFALLFRSIRRMVIKDREKIGSFVVYACFLPGIIIMVSDILFQRQASAVPRYMMPAYIGVMIAFAYLFNEKLSSPESASRRIWKIIFIVMIGLSIFSCIYSQKQSPKYQKTRNIQNIPIAEIINRSIEPLILFEKNNALDIVSLSYSLKESARVQLLSDDNKLKNIISGGCERDVYIFTPSDRLKKQILLEPVYRPDLFLPNELHLSLWKVTFSPQGSCTSNL